MVQKHLAALKKEFAIDLVIVNGENSSPRGRGITPKIVKFFKQISKNHLPKFCWKTIRNKLWQLSPGTYKNKKARLNKKNITEQDQELWSRIDEFSQFLNNKKIEMKNNCRSNIYKS